jgi:hypothetical protein
MVDSDLLSSSFSPRAGERFADRFELTAPLRGEGAVQAFLASDHHVGREVELMLFDPTCAHPNAWGAFARIVAAAAAAKIAGLVLPRNVGTSPPVPPYCVAEPQAARGLDRLRDQGPVPWKRALTIGERAAEILEKAHAATGVAHRVLTPSRCLVSVRDEVKVLDYGVAEIELGAGGESLYRAPGQAPADDSRGDVYSLAVIVFELIIGQRCTARTLPRLRSLVAAPQSVDDLLAKALAPEPAQRHADISALRANLRELLGLSPADPVAKASQDPPSLPAKASEERKAGGVPNPAATESATPQPPELPSKAASEERKLKTGAVASLAAKAPPTPQPSSPAKAASEERKPKTGAVPSLAAQPTPQPTPLTGRATKTKTGAVASLAAQPTPQPSLLTGRATSAERKTRTGAVPSLAAQPLDVVEPRELDERTEPLRAAPAARKAAPEPLPTLDRSVEPSFAVVPEGVMLPLPAREETAVGDPNKGPAAQASAPDRTVILDPSKGPVAQVPAADRTVILDASKGLGSQAPADRTVVFRTGSHPPVNQAAKSGLQAMAPDRTVIVDPTRERGLQAPAADRTMILDTNADGGPVVKTEIDPKRFLLRSRAMGARASRPDDGAPARGDTTMIIPQPEGPEPEEVAPDEEEEDARPVAPARKVAKGPAPWTVRRILIVTNVVLAAVIMGEVGKAHV